MTTTHPGRNGQLDDPPPTQTPSRLSLPDPLPADPPPRRLGLTPVDLSAMHTPTRVTPLAIRELKGSSQPFTVDLSRAYQLPAIAHKPPGSFDTSYQIVADGLQAAPQLANLIKLVAFLPAYAWASHSVVLMPLKMSGHGQAVLHALRTLHPRFPSYKAFKVWDETQMRHLVYTVELTPGEAERVAQVGWPGEEEIGDALSATAYHTLDDLSEVNDEVRTRLAARQVG